jgi:heat shock protein HslJ
MFCQETATAENTYLTALNQVNAAKLNGGKLQLLNGDKTLLVFTQSN